MRVPLVGSDEPGNQGEDGGYFLLLAARVGKACGIADVEGGRRVECSGGASENLCFWVVMDDEQEDGRS
ncbi:hypothetical protein B0T09DRAFT_346161 [Sordaria sp. MPI-SDFR-AT-0083]|nr:hypothetical protein B0T09DRAFT_346161 [Sordaria sp. MPI-SDFR-AT-0083]